MHKDPHYKNCRFLQVQDLEISDSKISVTYEYLPVSLAELCGSPGLDDQDIACILKQVIVNRTKLPSSLTVLKILEGLGYIHKHSLKYFVLECSNILLNYTGEVKLCKLLLGSCLALLSYLQISYCGKSTDEERVQSIHC